MTTYVFSDKASLAAQLAAGAKQLGTSKVVAISTGFEVAGADEIKVIDVPKDAVIEDAASTIADIAADADTLLIGATVAGRCIAGKVAALFDTTAIANVSAVSSTGDGIEVTHTMYGGAAMRTERVLGKPVVLVIAQGVWEAAEAPCGATEHVGFIEPAMRARRMGAEPKSVTAVDISASKRILCVGRGIANEDDLAIARDLADALQADMACTRPLGEGEGALLASELYIGVSGKTVKPDLYIGLGVSGQAQHTVGMVESGTIVYINTDANCPAMRYCDYGVVGDYRELAPKLAAAIRA